MSRRLEMTLPMPPSVNSYWRSVVTREGKTKVLISKHGRQWKKRALLLAQMQCRSQFDGEVDVEVWWYFRRRGADTDNPVKPLLDLLQGVVFANDKQVRDLYLHKRYDSGNPRCVVVVRPAVTETAEAA